MKIYVDKMPETPLRCPFFEIGMNPDKHGNCALTKYFGVKKCTYFGDGARGYKAGSGPCHCLKKLDKPEPEKLKAEKVQPIVAVPTGANKLSAYKTYEGFGRQHTAGQWAEILNLPRNTLWRYLKKGMSIEEVCQKRGIRVTAQREE